MVIFFLNLKAGFPLLDLPTIFPENMALSCVEISEGKAKKKLKMEVRWKKYYINIYMYISSKTEEGDLETSPTEDITSV